MVGALAEEAIDAGGLAVDVQGEVVEEEEESVTVAELERRIELHLLLLKQKLGFEERVDLPVARVAQQVLQRAVDDIPEALQHHLVDVLRVLLPLLRLPVGVEHLRVLVQQCVNLDTSLLQLVVSKHESKHMSDAPQQQQQGRDWWGYEKKYYLFSILAFRPSRSSSASCFSILRSCSGSDFHVAMMRWISVTLSLHFCVRCSKSRTFSRVSSMYAHASVYKKHKFIQ